MSEKKRSPRDQAYREFLADADREELIDTAAEWREKALTNKSYIDYFFGGVLALLFAPFVFSMGVQSAIALVVLTPAFATLFHFLVNITLKSTEETVRNGYQALKAKLKKKEPEPKE